MPEAQEHLKETPQDDSGQPGSAEDSPKVFVDENEWLKTQTELAELKGYKQGVQDAELRLGQQHPEIQPQAPAPPQKPEFQYHSEEDLQKALDEGDLKLYHKMSKHNQKTELAEEIWKLETTKILPIQQAGSSAITELSGAVARSEMPHLDIPEVKRSYEAKINQFKASGQAITREIHKGVYDLSVGENAAKVEEKIRQGLLRQAEEIQPNTPTTQSGRRAEADLTKVPSVEEAFEPIAIQKLQQKYPGLSPEQAADREFHRHGGWAGYYKKFYAKKEEKK